MRLLSIALITTLPIVVACGGGGEDDPVDARPRIDSRPTPDASSGCMMATTYDRDFDDPPDGEIDVLSLGNATTPVEIAGQLTTDTMDMAFAIIGDLGGLEPELPTHGYQMLFIDNAGMFTAAPFSGSPVPTLLDLDADDMCGGCLRAWGGWTEGPTIDLTTALQVFQHDTGTITIDQFNPGAVAGGTSLVSGSYDTITMTGFDPVSGAALVPACTSSVTKLNFTFNVTWAAAAVAPTAPGPKGQRIDWSKVRRVPVTRN